jgi:MFS family permease
VPSALALVTATFPAPDQGGRALGAFGAMSALGFVVGVVAGGAVTQHAGWRAVMLLTVPVAALLIPAVLAVVPESRAGAAAGPLDLPGAVVLSVGLGGLIFGTVRLGTHGASSPTVWGPLLAGLLLVAAFIAIECRSADPMLPPGLLRHPGLAAANAANALKSAVGMAQLYVLTLFLQQVLEATPWQTGLAFTPMALGGVAAAVAAGRHQARFGVRTTASLGCLVLLGGLVLVVVQLRPDALLAGVVAAMVVVEAGFMTAGVALTVAATTALPDRRGLAAGVLNTTTELGNALGLGLAGAVVGWRGAALAQLPAPEALAGALRWGLGAAIAAAVLALLVVRAP